MKNQHPTDTKRAAQARIDALSAESRTAHNYVLRLQAQEAQLSHDVIAHAFNIGADNNVHVGETLAGVRALIATVQASSSYQEAATVITEAQATIAQAEADEDALQAEYKRKEQALREARDAAGRKALASVEEDTNVQAARLALEQAEANRNPSGK